MMDAMREQPLIAVDVVPVAFRDEGLVIGTAARQFEPFTGEQALPGVLLAPAELLSAAAYRALDSKAGVADTSVRAVLQLGAFDGPGRDPRDSAISVAFLAVIDPGASTLMRWNPARSGRLGLPFDHDDIIQRARALMSDSLWTNRDLTRALTGPVFTTARAAAIHEEVRGSRPHINNLRRDLAASPHLEQVTEMESAKRRPGRPSLTWRWVRDEAG